MGSSKKQTVGYQYFMGLHFIPCYGPVDFFLEMQAGNLSAWVGVCSEPSTININLPGLFGGDQREGGLVGNIDVMMGAPDQMPNAYLDLRTALPYPVAYRGLLSLVAHGSGSGDVPSGLPGIIGAILGDTSGRSGFQVGSNNPYTKPWAFRLARALMGWQNGNCWYPETALVTLSNGARAMNPVHICYQVLTDSDFGKGYPTGVMDDAFCRVAALQCFTEGTGLCMRWVRTGTVEDFLQTVCDLAALVIRPSRSTGLTQIKCIRADYVISELLHLTNDDTYSLDSLDDTIVTGAINEITGQYFDPTTRTNGALTVQNLGSIQSQGVVIPQTKSYLAIGASDLLARIIERDLRVTAIPLRRLKGNFKPKAWQLAEGDVFVWSYPSENIYNDVYRIGEIDYGDLQNAKIAITAVEDVYQFPDQSYVIGAATAWTPPNKNPTPSPNTLGFEASYRDVLREGKDPATLPPGAGYAAIACEQPGSLATNYEIFGSIGGGYPADTGANGDWTPDATLTANIGAFDTAIQLQAMTNFDLVEAGQVAILGTERVRIDTVNPTTGNITIGRGCEYTQAVSHPAGVLFWVVDEAAGSDGTTYYEGETVYFYPLTNTTGGQLALGLAPLVPVVMDGRALKPYPPVYLHVNGTRWDQIITAQHGQLSVVWNTRNRVIQDDQLIDSTQASVVPEAGTTFTGRVYASTGALLLTQANAPNPWIFNPGAIVDRITVTVASELNGLECEQVATATFNYSPPLALTGNFTGGNVGVPYSSSINITGGSGVYSNPRVTSGALPDGLALSIVGDTLVLSGNPTDGATFNFTAAVDSSDGQTTTSAQSVTVSGSSEISAQYWRIYITANNGDPSYTTVAELQLRGAVSGPNLCTPALAVANASASSAAGSNTADKAFDGNTTTRWTDGNTLLPAWLCWNFGTPTVVAEIALMGQYTGSDQGLYPPKAFQIQHSDDNVTWTTYGSFTDQTGWGAGEIRVYEVGGSMAVLSILGDFTPAVKDSSYSSALTISGGVAPYSLAGSDGVISGALPDGLALSIVGDTLVLSGDATTNGSNEFVAGITSSDSQSANTDQTVVVGALVFTKLDPANKCANVTLDATQLIATGTDSSGFARSVDTLVGKQYFETVIGGSGLTDFAWSAGLSAGTGSTSASLGYADSDGYAFWVTGAGARHAGTTVTPYPATIGDVIGWAVDVPNGNAWIRVNGVWINGDPTASTPGTPTFTGLPSTLYAAACPWVGSTYNLSVTMRFDPATFRNAIPDGFSPVRQH
jgi:hypothetical protein